MEAVYLTQFLIYVIFLLFLQDTGRDLPRIIFSYFLIVSDGLRSKKKFVGSENIYIFLANRV